MGGVTSVLPKDAGHHGVARSKPTGAQLEPVSVRKKAYPPRLTGGLVTAGDCEDSTIYYTNNRHRLARYSRTGQLRTFLFLKRHLTSAVKSTLIIQNSFYYPFHVATRPQRGR